MDFQEHQVAQSLSIEAYGSDFIQINQQIYHQSMILGDEIILLKQGQSVAELSAEDFQIAVQAGVDVILLGTGEKHQFIHPKIIAALSSQGVSIECMTTAAACRTLTLLQSEGRKVWAWLFIN